MKKNEVKKILLGQKTNVQFRRRFPIILQSESSECGLACLAMIMGWYRSETDLMSLRQQFGISSRGATLTDIINISSQCGMATRPLSLDVEDLSQIRVPCILHWDFSHFVVLTQVTKRRCVIHDPAAGKRVISFREISEHFTGVALEIWPDSEFKPIKQRKRLELRTLAGSIIGLGSSLAIIFSLSLVTEFISLLLPVGTQMVMDHSVPASDRGLLMLICLGLLLLSLLQAGVGILRNRTSLILNTMTDMQWKDGLFRHLLRLPLMWFEKRYIGDIQSRFGSLDAIRTTFTHNITKALTDSIMACGALTLLIMYGGWLAGVVVGITLIYVLMRLITYPIYKQTSEELLVKNSRSSSGFTETLFAISTIRAQGLETQRRKIWLSQVANSINTEFHLAKFDMLFTVISAFIAAVDNVLILWLGISIVIDHQMTVGAFVAFSSFRGLFSDRILSLTGLFLQLRMLTVHSDRISDIALSEPENDENSCSNIISHGALSLVAKDLTFNYDSATTPVFTKINITVNEGESVAIIGPSGCGKSTLMKILCGLTPPTEGQIFAGGRDILHSGIQNYRKSVACILQEDRLLAGSLKNNITGFSEKPDEDWMIECSKLAKIHDDINMMPMKYETLIGELGEGLSGGQRQRIFIARAIYRKPSILFMDEATSHLDELNEGLINKAISSLGMTKIIIAHRATTIASADRLIDLEKIKNDGEEGRNGS